MTAESQGKRYAFIWSEKSVANPGEVLVKFTWKQTKEMKEIGKKAHDARFVSAPVLRLALAGDDSVFTEFCEDALAEYQRSKIAEFLTEALDRGDTQPEVPEDFFDKQILLMLWQEEQESSGKGRGKLSGEAIGEFFDASVKDKLFAHIVSKKGLVIENLKDEERKKLGQSVAQYRTLMMKLAKSDSIDMEYLKQAAKALEIAGAESEIVGGRIMRNIQKRMAAPKDEELMEAL